MAYHSPDNSIKEACEDIERELVEIRKQHESYVATTARFAREIREGELKLSLLKQYVAIDKYNPPAAPVEPLIRASVAKPPRKAIDMTPDPEPEQSVAGIEQEESLEADAG